MSLAVPEGSAPVAGASAAAPAFNPPSLDVNDYTASVWNRIDLKPGKYYVMSFWDSPSHGSIVKVTKVTPFPPGTPYVSPGSAKVEVQEDSGTILPQTTTMAYKYFFEYRIPPKNIPIPNEMEPSEPLTNANAIRTRNLAHRQYQERESYTQSKAKYYTRRSRRNKKNRRRQRRSRRN
jgi:hypothetical protein